MKFDAPPAVTLVVGSAGCGKSSFALAHLRRMLGNHSVFVFDWKVSGPGGGEFSKRLRVRQTQTAAELNRVKAGHCVAFNPHAMFPGALQAAFRFFCAWTFQVSHALPGRKLLLVDELQKFTGPSSCPRELSAVVETGRAIQLGSLFIAQQPQALPGTVCGQVTELVTFRQVNPNARARLAEMGLSDADRAASLPRFRFIALNCESGGEITANTSPDAS